MKRFATLALLAALAFLPACKISGGSEDEGKAPPTELSADGGSALVTVIGTGEK
jgi:hypothetical protein